MQRYIWQKAVALFGHSLCDNGGQFASDPQEPQKPGDCADEVIAVNVPAFLPHKCRGRHDLAWWNIGSLQQAACFSRAISYRGGRRLRLCHQEGAVLHQNGVLPQRLSDCPARSLDNPASRLGLAEGRCDPAGNLVDMDRPFDGHYLAHQLCELGDWCLMRLDTGPYRKVGPDISRHLDGQMIDVDRPRLWFDRRFDHGTRAGLIGAAHADAGLDLFARTFQRSLQPFDLALAVMKPVGAPDAVEPPAQVFQDVLPQPVAFPRP